MHIHGFIRGVATVRTYPYLALNRSFCDTEQWAQERQEIKSTSFSNNYRKIRQFTDFKKKHQKVSLMDLKFGTVL